ncbi:MAG: hypothetical protein ACOH1R_07460 [Luteimonas sp.]
MSTRLLLCLLLTCASFPLMAHNTHMMGANGDNGAGCPDNTPRSDASTSRQAGTKPAAHAAKPAKAKANASQGGDNLGDVRPPRWHSFLPGMFR